MRGSFEGRGDDASIGVTRVSLFALVDVAIDVSPVLADAWIRVVAEVIREPMR
jgi:hypothetical protein